MWHLTFSFFCAVLWAVKNQNEMKSIMETTIDSGVVEMSDDFKDVENEWYNSWSWWKRWPYKDGWSCVAILVGHEHTDTDVMLRSKVVMLFSIR